MSLNELQALEFPKLGADAVWRKINKTKTMLLRKSKMSARKLRTRTILFFRSQYYLTQANRDLKSAAVRNEDMIITSLITAAALVFSYMNMAGEALLIFFQTAYDIAELSGVNMVLLLALVAGIFGVVGGWLAAFLLNMLSLSVMDGANRKLYKSVRMTARKSLRYASRVTGAWVSYLTVLLVPLVAVAVPSYLYFKAAANPMAALESIFPFIAVAGISSTTLLVINYGLVPYVALFEPETPLHTALDRSYNLVKKRGRLFILAIYGLFAGALYASYVLASAVEQRLYVPKSVTFFILAGVVILYANCIMVMLYRKRKLARK